MLSGFPTERGQAPSLMPTISKILPSVVFFLSVFRPPYHQKLEFSLFPNHWPHIGKKVSLIAFRHFTKTFCLWCAFSYPQSWHIWKINTPPWVFFAFFKLYKCYQIAWRTTYMNVMNTIRNFMSQCFLINLKIVS